ncbi:MAG: indole-3-glycerol phosphate synthase TrpC [Pseudomonadota bacterium]
MSTILARIVEDRVRRLTKQKGLTSLEVLEQDARNKPPSLDFVGSFTGSGPCIIAEVKKASPSRGVIKQNLDVRALAGAYEQGGAVAVSVLTEEDHFRGSLSVLEEVRRTVSLPILRKDFITDPYQIVEARAAGADSFLLIAAILEEGALKQLIRFGRKWRMEPLVEIHNLSELHRALQTDALVLGINNRDLTTFGVDLSTTIDLVKRIPRDRTVISESGISTREDVLRLADAGVHGFLIGETLVRSDDPAGKIRELRNGI